MHEDGRPEPAGERLGRLTRRAEFQRVSRGRRVSVETFTLQSRRREGPEAASGARVGLTVTKGVGGAVERNRVRRRLKEALRAAAPLEAEGDHDYVLMARREALGAASPRSSRTCVMPSALLGAEGRIVAGGRRPTLGRRSKTGEHEVRGYPEPVSRYRAVGAGDGRLAIFLRRPAVSARASGADAGQQSGSKERGSVRRRAGSVGRIDGFAAGRRGERFAAWSPGGDGAANDRRGPGGKPARDDRYAEHRRLDRPQGRQDRRHHSQGLSRDHRPEESNIRLFSPPGAPDAYFAETGFVSPDGARRPISTPSGPPTARP